MSVYKDRSCGRDRWIVKIYKGGHKILFYTDSKRGLPLLTKEDAKKAEAGLSDFLFPGEHGAYVINEGHVRRLVIKYANMAGLKPLRVHEFRHSCASNLIRNGMPLRIVAQWLGDTESTVLDYYSHMFPDESQSVAKFFESHPLETKDTSKSASEKKEALM